MNFINFLIVIMGLQTAQSRIISPKSIDVNPDQSILDHRFPKAIIIGVKKSGTRAVLEFLRLNPQVRAPGPEVHFFDRHYDRGLEWYRRQMPLTTEAQFTVEKTPRYFISKEAPERMYRWNRHVKLLVVVRDPVTRAISDYTQTSSKRADMPPFEQMAFNQTTFEVNKSWGAVKIGIYERHVRRWLQYFPLNQLHFVNGEQLISEPAKVMQTIEHFLGLNASINQHQFVMNGSSKGFPCVRKPATNLQSNPHNISGQLEGGTTTHCLGKTKGREHPKLSTTTLNKLRTFYEPFNKRFYELIGNDFQW